MLYTCTKLTLEQASDTLDYSSHYLVLICRLQYFARGVQIYIKQLRQDLQGKSGDALKTDEVCSYVLCEDSSNKILCPNCESIFWIIVMVTEWTSVGGPFHNASYFLASKDGNRYMYRHGKLTVQKRKSILISVCQFGTYRNQTRQVITWCRWAFSLAPKISAAS